jgi:hypothetical protein
VKRASLILLCLVAIAVAISTCISTPTKLPPRITFPAGDSAILRQLTCGTSHVAPTERDWRRLLPSFVRPFLSHPFHGINLFRDLVTAKPSLVLWIENTPGKPPFGPTGPTWLMLADETGHAGGSKAVYPHRYRASKGTVQFASWPRSSQNLIIRWFEGKIFEQGKLLGEWVVPNPAFQPPARWVAESLPVTHTNGPLRCTLERVLSGLDSPGQRTNDGSGRRLSFALARTGQEAAAVLMPRFTADSPAANWEVGSVLLRDASGNEVRREPLWLQVDETCCSFTPALWPANTWEVTIFAKRHVPFHLPVSESFSPDELLVFKDVEPTGPDGAALNQEPERSGVRLRLTQFTLRPPKDLNEPWQPADASEVLATLSRSPNSTAHVDLAGVTDDHGQAHYPRAYGLSTGGSSNRLGLSYRFPTLPRDTRKLTIIFVVQPGREFTFHVKPEVASSPVHLP